MENVEGMIYNEKDFLPGRQHKILAVKQSKEGRTPRPRRVSCVVSEDRTPRNWLSVAYDGRLSLA